MTTMKLTIALSILSGLTIDDAVVLTAPNGIRPWVESKRLTHFTFNPKTEKFSWIEFPTEPFSHWSKTLIYSAKKADAGIPGSAFVDEPTITEGFWVHNRKTYQNNLFFKHLIQDQLYYEYISKFVDTHLRYSDVYRFEGRTLTGKQFFYCPLDKYHGLSLFEAFESQLFIAVASQIFLENKILINTNWFEDNVIPAFNKIYPKELMSSAMNSLRLTPNEDSIISEQNFNLAGPVPLSAVYNFIDNLLYWIA